MILNKRQRVVISIAVVLIAAMGIYPPWRGIEKTGTYSPVSEYGWIFSPPVLPWFLEGILAGMSLSDLASSHPDIKKYLDPADWAWEIDVRRFLVQWATVVLVALGLILIMKQK